MISSCLYFALPAVFANWLHNDQSVGAPGPGTTEDGDYFLNGTTNNDFLMAVSREADWKWAITSEDEYYSIGFHVSAVPDPTSMALIALGGLAVLKRRSPKG